VNGRGFAFGLASLGLEALMLYDRCRRGSYRVTQLDRHDGNNRSYVTFG
jgi:hypothetical protein